MIFMDKKDFRVLLALLFFATCISTCTVIEMNKSQKWRDGIDDNMNCMPEHRCESL